MYEALVEKVQRRLAERPGAADDVFMTARDGVKRTGINGDARHAAASSA